MSERGFIAVHARIAGDSHYSPLVDIAATYLTTDGQKEDLYKLLKPCRYKNYQIAAFDGFGMTVADLDGGNDYYESLSELGSWIAKRDSVGTPIVIHNGLVSAVLEQHKLCRYWMAYKSIIPALDLMGIEYTPVFAPPSMPASHTSALLAQFAIETFTIKTRVGSN